MRYYSAKTLPARTKKDRDGIKYRKTVTSLGFQVRNWNDRTTKL